ncbi:isochorismatase family protein [Chenggangzhangella methanolivorans]|uniref:Isochorismatase family protein n=1 Tax=Chenggangzhangella methanolivorans TaxID=1437009 RepID=A0A9E6RH12_9HYPH|nr:isochorismatase family protein [Chenggangzhangella methanolivorans]QZO00877.1 isochorismatase family protein [Chenggangzhangella methanolivorans]
MTDAPKTLIELAGADPQPASLKDATLVVIDAQNEYVDGPIALPGVGPALGAIADLLAAARAAGTPIVHLAHRAPAGVFVEGTQGAEIAPQAAPKDGEPVFKKELPNGFTNPEFKPALEKLGRKNLILTGFMTHMCVDSTARAAVDLGYGVTIVENATASRPLPGAVGKASRSAQEVHDGALAGLADLFAVVVKDAEGLSK